MKRMRILAVGLCILITLVLSYLLYSTEFKYSIDKTDLSVAITEFEEPHKGSIEAVVLETKEIDGILLASFKDRKNESINGVAKFLKGFNNKYRIVQTRIEVAEYSNIVQLYRVDIKDKRYIAVSGYNLSDEIKYYGLDYFTYANPGELAKDRVQESVKFEVKNRPFIEVHKSEEIEGILLESVESDLHSYYLVDTSIYDEDGVEMIEKFRTVGVDKRNISTGASKAELFMLYVFIFIVLVVGIIITRYFLTT